MPSSASSDALISAFSGVAAGFASTALTHPLDRIKTVLQVSPTSLGIFRPLKNIVKAEGLTGLYRGLGVNIAANLTSWGFYFLWYSVLKDLQGAGQPGVQLNAGQHLLASATSGVITAFITNPLWVVKTRMYTTSKKGAAAYRSTLDGLVQISKKEGIPGLYKGTVMSVVGVSNGAIQFMLYEELKRLAKERRLQRRTSEMEILDLSNVEVSLMSGAAKMLAIGLTYPYQVVRSRMQYQQLSIASVNIAQQQDQPYTSIRDVVRRTYASEGLKAFYKGLGANVIRILPGTCVTFVVYENCSAYLRRKALERADR